MSKRLKSFKFPVPKSRKGNPNQSITENEKLTSPGQTYSSEKQNSESYPCCFAFHLNKFAQSALAFHFRLCSDDENFPFSIL